MKKRFLFASLFFLFVFVSISPSPYLNNARAASLAVQKKMVLYDASSGSIPSESLMDFTDFPPGAATLTYAEGASVMDTTPSGQDTYAGWVSSQGITSGFPILDRTAGIQVDFTLQVEGENHERAHRAGFSMIVLDQDARGIELSFWKNEIWAQNDTATGGLFTHGEGISFTTTDPVNYQLRIVGDTYTLSANSQPVLSGPVRDYSEFEGFPDPYETPNFLFLGDNTTAAQARIRLRFLSITGSEPVPPTVAVTSTSTNAPLATPSFTPVPSIAPLPSQTPPPPPKGTGICPSGGLILVVGLTSVFFQKMVRRRTKMLQ